LSDPPVGSIIGSTMTDLYDRLQVSPRAEPDVIRAAYRALAKRLHPDSGGDSGRMVELNEAWSVLSDPIQRAVYDAKRGQPIFASVTQAASPSHPGGTVLDFGRYAGWTVDQVADNDPDYLEWLIRTPIGRRLRAEVETVLTERAVAMAALRPKPAKAGRFARR
jgi:curved DNA-binding protein CbpA